MPDRRPGDPDPSFDNRQEGGQATRETGGGRVRGFGYGRGYGRDFGGVDISPIVAILVLQGFRIYLLPMIFAPIKAALG